MLNKCQFTSAEQGSHSMYRNKESGSAGKPFAPASNPLFLYNNRSWSIQTTGKCCNKTIQNTVCNGY